MTSLFNKSKLVSGILVLGTLSFLSVGMVYSQEAGAETEAEAETTVVNPDVAKPEDTSLVGPDSNPVQPEPETAQPPTVATTSPSKRIAIRYYVLQGGGTRAYEIRRGSKTGGRFRVWSSPKGSVNNLPILGYTDRVAAGETVLVHIGGGGNAKEAGVKFGKTKRFSSQNINLPFNLRRRVTPVVGTSIFTYVIQDGKGTVVKRLPVGPRGR
jgi:hypothetical protein